MFLTTEELNQLTGCKVGGYQCRWLERHGYRFERSANGKPAVLRSHVEAKLGGADQPKERRLNMSALRG